MDNATLTQIETNPVTRQHFVEKTSYQLHTRDTKGSVFLITTVDVAPFIKELEENEKADPTIWDQIERKNIAVQRETSALVLKRILLDADNDLVKVGTYNLAKPVTEYGDKFPALMKFASDFAQTQGGELSAIQLARIPAGHQVYRHYDKGKYYLLRDRYHLVLKSEGSRMVVNDVSVLWHQGEVWWFNNKQPHEAYNETGVERIHVIFDVITDKMKMIEGATNEND